MVNSMVNSGATERVLACQAVCRRQKIGEGGEFIRRPFQLFVFRIFFSTITVVIFSSLLLDLGNHGKSSCQHSLLIFGPESAPQWQHLERIMEEMKFEFVREGPRVKYVPGEQDFAECRALGLQVAQKFVE